MVEVNIIFYYKQLITPHKGEYKKEDNIFVLIKKIIRQPLKLSFISNNILFRNFFNVNNASLNF